MTRIVLLLMTVALYGADQKKPAAKPAPAAKAAERAVPVDQLIEKAAPAAAKDAGKAVPEAKAAGKPVPVGKAAEQAVPVAGLLKQAAPAAAQPAAKPAPAASPAPAAKAVEKAAPVTIPEGAELIAPATYRYIDKSGKSWIYRRTPFGLSRVEEMQAPAAGTVPAMTVKATDLGDSVRFEKPTPMGAGVWIKKKSELTADEKEWLAKSGTKAGEK